MRSGERSGWILGLVLIAVGGVFLLQNSGFPVLVGNWWALFILIPAIGAFAAAWTLYQQTGQLTGAPGQDPARGGKQQCGFS